MVLCLLLNFFPALKIFVSGDKIAKHDTINMISLIIVVLPFQIFLLHTIISYPVNKTIYSILYLLLLSSATSTMQVSIVSWNAAIIILIFWVLLIASVVNYNRQEIYNVSIVVSKGIQTLILVVFVLTIAYVVYCVVHSLSS
jgi:hypothetical protein